METIPSTPAVKEREYMRFDRLRADRLSERQARRAAVRRWYRLRQEALKNRYYRWRTTHSPNRFRDRQAFEAMGRVMIQQTINAEPTVGLRRLRRRELAMKWRQFMRAIFTRRV